MLSITVASVDAFDEKTQRFVTSPEATLTLEHSLVSISKWESKWKIPFLGRQEKSPEQIIDYIQIMNTAPVSSAQVFDFITQPQLEEIFHYMNDNPTATFLPDQRDKRPSSEPVTSELIYYWMTVLNIPFSCETWHLQKLLTLIRVANLKQGPKKKMSKSELISRQRSLNEQRRKQYGTNG